MPYELLQDIGERRKGERLEAVELTGGGMAGAIQLQEMLASGQVREVAATAPGAGAAPVVASPKVGG